MIYVEAKKDRAGKVYCWRVRAARTKNKRRVWETLKVCETEQEAVAFQKACLLELNRTSPKRTIRSLGLQLIRKPGTTQKTESLFWRHIDSDPIADMEPEEITPEDALAFRERLLEKQVVRAKRKKTGDEMGMTYEARDRTISIATARNAYNFLTKILKTAFPTLRDKRQLPTIGFAWPVQKTVVEHGIALKPDQVDALCRIIDTPERHMVAFLAATGLRLGEAVSLHWQDVIMDDDECPHIMVRYGGPPREGTDGKIAFPSTKSGKPRMVPLLPKAIEALDNWRREAPAWLTEQGRKNPMGLVFPTQNGRCRTAVHLFAYGRWTRFRAELGLPQLRVHDLRHTCATSLLHGWWGHRWSVKEVQYFLGHADARTTERYFKERNLVVNAAAKATWQANAKNPRKSVGDKWHGFDPAFVPHTGQTTPQKHRENPSRLGDLNPRPTVYERDKKPGNSGFFTRKKNVECTSDLGTSSDAQATLMVAQAFLHALSSGPEVVAWSLVEALGAALITVGGSEGRQDVTERGQRLLLERNLGDRPKALALAKQMASELLDVDGDNAEIGKTG